MNVSKKLIIILSVVCVSFSAILVRFADAPSMVLVLYRNLFAAVAMSVPCIRQLKTEYKDYGKKELICCAVSGVFLALHFSTYFESLRYTNISSSTVLVDMEVFFVAFIMLFFFKEKISVKGWIGIVLTFVGSIMVAAGDMSSGTNVVLGDAMAISGAFFVAVYTIMGRICRRKMSTTVYTTFVYYIAALTVFVILSVRNVPVMGWEMKNYLVGIGMALLCSLLGHSIFSWGLKYIEPSFISIVKLLEPVFASVLGIFFFSEIPGVSVIVGGVLVIGGIVYYMRASE